MIKNYRTSENNEIFILNFKIADIYNKNKISEIKAKCLPEKY